MASGFCCPKHFHPRSCQCKPFSHRISIKCSRITHVPRDLPLNTAILDLPSNQLSSIKEYTFGNLTMLKKVNLSKNELRTFPQSTFHLPNLTKIDLSCNMLKFIPEKAFQNLTSLTYLDLQQNLLKHIPQSAFQN
ncbi:leucine-rich repeat and transmembrane domain-containing protein 2-like [Stylophora pistillata]|uniref:leucine-rich repeat and transmembrane domain-containing protein 2-like n=1 Tax=Stylophora pistillata TaxID=50429 RepID=UPI000C0512B8|nr:leucine-rich repeat and transmembrane domain-containing protein 2-like [Stylophora pistillata]